VKEHERAERVAVSRSFPNDHGEGSGAA
jgi:hypothetical protein